MKAEKINAPFHPITAVEARQWYKDGLLTTSGYLWAIRRVTCPPNVRFVIPNVVNFCEEWGISRAAFYRAVKHLDKDCYMSWEATHGLAFEDSKKVVNFPSTDEKCLDRETVSQKRDTKSHKRDSQSHKRDTPYIYGSRARSSDISDRSDKSDVVETTTEPAIEVEILPPSQEGQVAEPEANTEALYEQEVQTEIISSESETTQEDTFSAAADPEILKEIERIAHNWKLRPWRETAQRFKPDMIRAVWQCNPGYYSLQGTRTPNQHHILKALQLLERQLKSLDAAAINAYYELKRYWQTAQALANPNVQHAFVAAAAQSKEQVEAMERQRQAQIDAERLRKDLGL